MVGVGGDMVGYERWVWEAVSVCVKHVGVCMSVSAGCECRL